MAGGQAIEGAKRGVLFHVDPDTLELQGIDYTSGPEDVCYNPRNKEPVDEMLVESIMRLGVLQAINVVKVSCEGKEKIRVQCGNQRVRATREANRRLRAAGKDPITVPCLTPLRGFAYDELSEVAIAENEHRRETGAMAKAELAAIHLRRKGGDMGEAAKAFGMRIDQFKALINLKDAAPEIKQAVEAGKIGTVAATELASLPKSDQPKRLEEAIAAGGTAAAAKDVVKEAKGTVATTKPSKSVIARVVKALEDGAEVRGVSDGHCYDAGFQDALAWVLGDLTTDEIEGLGNLVKAKRVQATDADEVAA